MIDPTKFFFAYRAAFGITNDENATSGDRAILIHAFNDEPAWSDIRHVAYALATIKHETADTFRPIEERGSRLYLSKYFLSPRLRRNLGNKQLSDAWTFKGRGYVQLTGRINYELFGKMLGLPLATQPELALDPMTAFRIMTIGMKKGLFTGKKLSDYINVGQPNYVQARKVINGLDQAEKIAGYAHRFETILVEASQADAGTIPHRPDSLIERHV